MTLPAAERMARPREIEPLTGVRGVAAVLVMLYHFELNDQGAVAAGAVPAFLLHAYLWVDFFFVLSGFVMTLTYGPLFAGSPSPARSYGVFLAHRLARLYPLYCTVTGVAVVLHAGGLSFGAPSLPASALLSNLLMVQAWGFADSLVHPSWSVSAEWAAYLLFPALLAAGMRTGPRAAGLLALACATAIAALTCLPRPVLGIDPLLSHGALDINQAGSLAPVLRCVAGFTLGILTYRLWTSRPPPVCALAGRRFAAEAAFGAALCALCVPMHADLLAYALFPACILLLADRGRGSWIGAALSCRPVHRLGTLSYAIYLLHFPLGGLWAACVAWLPGDMAPALRHALASAAVSALTIALAALCHAFIEKPGRALGRALLPSRRDATACAGPGLRARSSSGSSVRMTRPAKAPA